MLDPLKYFKTPLTGERKKQYDDNWDEIFKKDKDNLANIKKEKEVD